MSSFELPNIWPLLNLINIIQFDPTEHNKKNKKEEEKQKKTWYSELIIRHLRLSTYFTVAYLVYTYSAPSYKDLTTNTQPFPYLYWFSIIIIRDQLLVLSFYSIWHYILYQSSWSKKLKILKYNKIYPPQAQWNRDILWSSATISMVSVNEILMIIIIKQFPYLIYESYWSNPIYSLFWLLIIPYWIDLHFYWIHRAFHRWNWKLFGIIDVGKWLYSNAHYMHHIDTNPGPWSALSGNPFENWANFTGFWVPLCLFGVFPQHLYHLYFNKFFAIISPLPNHDGFDSPGGASHYHYLHHAHFECNYGSPMFPFDAWFGTYEDGSKYKKLQKLKDRKKVK